jgi:bacterioferritin-associated ferredoxin
MIVCSCNVFTDGDVRRACLEGPGCPRTPAEVYRCLGCSPECGHCARTIRGIMDKALAATEGPAGAGGCCSGAVFAPPIPAEPSR